MMVSAVLPVGRSSAASAEAVRSVRCDDCGCEVKWIRDAWRADERDKGESIGCGCGKEWGSGRRHRIVMRMD